MEKFIDEIDWEIAKPILVVIGFFVLLWTLIFFVQKGLRICKEEQTFSRMNSRRNSSVFLDDKLESYRYKGIVNIYKEDARRSTLRGKRLSPIPSLDRASVTSKYYSGMGSGKINIV